MLLPVLVYALYLVHEAVAPNDNERIYGFCPPATKRRRIALDKCLVAEYGVDIGKPCSNDKLPGRLSDMVANNVNDIGVSGVDNEADLILSRAGIFDWRQQPLSQLSLCTNHYNMLSRRFSRHRPTLKRGPKRFLKCAATDVPAAGIQHPDGKVANNHFVTKEQAQVLLEKNGILVHVGDGKNSCFEQILQVCYICLYFSTMQ